MFLMMFLDRKKSKINNTRLLLDLHYIAGEREYTQDGNSDSRQEKEH